MSTSRRDLTQRLTDFGSSTGFVGQGCLWPGIATGIPKRRDGRVEALRNLRVARRSAVEQCADTQRQIKTLIVTAPDELRAQLRGLSVKQLITTCAGMRPDRADAAAPTTAVTIALRSLAHRHQQLPPK